MNKVIVAAALCALAAPAFAAAQPAPPYAIAARIPGPDGGWDIASFDPARRRVYVARSDSIMAIDSTTGTVSKLAPASRSHEVLPLPGGRTVVETDGATDTARIVDANSGAVLAAVPTGKNPDAEAFDPATGLVFVGNGGSGDITVVDPAAKRAVATIPVGAKLEFSVADGRGRLFVNLEDKGEIAVVDTRARKVTGRYKLDGCEEPSGLAYAADRGLLISSCGDGVAKVVRASTGALVASLPIGRGPDTVMYDPVRGVALIPCGRDGVLEVISFAGGHPRVVAHVPTQRGARTGAVDPETGRVYLPTAGYGPPATPGGRPSLQPGTFQVLVLAPAGRRAQ